MKTPEYFDFTKVALSIKRNLNMETKKYSFAKGLGKGILSIIVFAVPIVINAFPEWANLTIGGLLTIAVNFIKVNYFSN